MRRAAFVGFAAAVLGMSLLAYALGSSASGYTSATTTLYCIGAGSDQQEWDPEIAVGSSGQGVIEVHMTLGGRPEARQVRMEARGMKILDIAPVLSPAPAFGAVLTSDVPIWGWVLQNFGGAGWVASSCRSFLYTAIDLGPLSTTASNPSQITLYNPGGTPGVLDGYAIADGHQVDLGGLKGYVLPARQAMSIDLRPYLPDLNSLFLHLTSSVPILAEGLRRDAVSQLVSVARGACVLPYPQQQAAKSTTVYLSNSSARTGVVDFEVWEGRLGLRKEGRIAPQGSAAVTPPSMDAAPNESPFLSCTARSRGVQVVGAVMSYQSGVVDGVSPVEFSSASGRECVPAGFPWIAGPLYIEAVNPSGAPLDLEVLVKAAPLRRPVAILKARSEPRRTTILGPIQRPLDSEGPLLAVVHASSRGSQGQAAGVYLWSELDAVPPSRGVLVFAGKPC
jgi:hypothetical protein